MTSISRALNSASPIVLLVARLLIGGLLLWHGIDKFDTGIGNVTDFFDAEGVPIPGLAAPFTAVVEVVGGALIMAGALTRLSSLVLALVLFGAYVFVASANPLLGGSELEFAYIAALVALVAAGAGSLSVDRLLGWEEASVSD